MCIRDKAYTIHKKIYRQRNFANDLDNFSLDDNLHQHTLFIVDEASMIANDGLAGAVFGTCLLYTSMVFNVICLEFGVQKSRVDRLFKK